MIAPLPTLCPSLTGRLTKTPGTWNASSALLDASTFPGKDRVSDSFPAVTTIVLTGRMTSGAFACCVEHPAVKQTAATATATFGPEPACRRCERNAPAVLEGNRATSARLMRWV